MVILLRKPKVSLCDTPAMFSSPEATHRVLVVDDEPNIVDVISMALRFQGFAVESAGDRRATRSRRSPRSGRT